RHTRSTRDWSSDVCSSDLLQLQYNVLTREGEAGLLASCREHDVAAVAYSPLAGGLLTGKYRKGQQTFPAGSRFDVVPAFAEIYRSEERRVGKEWSRGEERC